jgi:hypothetical protein
MVKNGSRLPRAASRRRGRRRAPAGRGTVVTVTARQPLEDEPRREVVASPLVRNMPAPGPVLVGMENTIREFSAGDRTCGDGVGRDLRAR